MDVPTRAVPGGTGMTTVTICMSAVVVVALIVALILDCMREKAEEMSFEQKQLTKKQLVEKMHNERRMWQGRVDQAYEQGKNEGVYGAHQMLNAVVAMMVRAFGSSDGDKLRLDVNVPEEREGYHWKTALQVVDDNTWRLIAEEVKDPEPEEQQPEGEE